MQSRKLLALLAIPAITLGIYLLAPNKAHAMGGCDTCVQQATRTLDTTLQTGLENLNKALDQTKSSVDALKSSMTDALDNMKSKIVSEGEETRKSINGMGTKIVAKQAESTKVLTSALNSELTAIIQALKDVTIAKRRMQISDAYGANAQPESNCIQANAAEAFTTTTLANERLGSGMTALLDEQANDVDIDAGRVGKYLENKREEWQYLDPTIILDDVISGEKLDDVPKVIAMLTNPIPSKRIDPELRESRSDYLKQQTLNSRKKMVQGILLEATKPQFGTMDSSWAAAYVAPETDGTGKTSEYAAIKALTEGRLASPEWYGEMKTILPTGLKREMVVLLDQQLLLNAELLKAERQMLKLQSISTAIELERSADGAKP